MALTLQQRINISKGLTDLSSSVTLLERVKEGIKKSAQDVCSGSITPASTVFTTHPVTQAQLSEWALRALRGSMDSYMVPMILDDNALPSDPNAATDANITTAVNRSIWPFAQLIGSGSI